MEAKILYMRYKSLRPLQPKIGLQELTIIEKLFNHRTIIFGKSSNRLYLGKAVIGYKYWKVDYWQDFGVKN